MKHIYLNLKRFDLDPSVGGVNHLAPIQKWAKKIVKKTASEINQYADSKFTVFLPEMHLLNAVKAKTKYQSNLQIGSQSVYRGDVAKGGNFGAFTSLLTAKAVRAAGATATMIGHCEERRAITECLLSLEPKADQMAVQRAVSKLLAQSVQRALEADLDLLFCLGEKEEEQASWQEVLRLQLEAVKGLDPKKLAIAYEPIWSIGPGKKAADRDYIQKIARFIKAELGNVPVVYGGGLKLDNAQMLASIPEIDGGLIALTQFTGQIAFNPEQYLAIAKAYVEAKNE